jgi:hypothetical protein
MSGANPIKQLLFDTQEYWDHEGTPTHVRDAFRKIIKCGTIALGAEVYASKAESALVFHTCKSRFCTSCGQRATEEWQADLEACPFTFVSIRPLLLHRASSVHLTHYKAESQESVIFRGLFPYLLVLRVNTTFDLWSAGPFGGASVSDSPLYG